MPRARRRRALQALVVAVALVPLARLAAGAAAGELGADPVETITHTTGTWALRLLLASLAVSPLRRALGWGALQPFRRTLGLLAFLYAALHFATWLVFEVELGARAAVEDVAERPWVTVGFAAFVSLVPLAATSTRGMLRRLGGRRWRRLHRLVYAAAVFAVLHFLWLVKEDVREPLLYAALAALLLGERALRALARRRRAAPAPAREAAGGAEGAGGPPLPQARSRM